MTCYEIEITAKLKNVIDKQDVGLRIVDLIHQCMNEDRYLTSLYLQNKTKPYSYSALYPSESGKPYFMNREYTFTMRTLDKRFAHALYKVIMTTTVQSDSINPIHARLKEKDIGFIQRIQTVTPTVITLSDGSHWKKEDKFCVLKRRLYENMLKKYREFTGENIHRLDTAFEEIQVLNKKPLITTFKCGYLIGHHFDLKIKPDAFSQELAKIAIITGLGEKSSSAGCGFCDYF